ncbi:MAG: DEAD/DEAH box helicase [Acetivibrionales bacterium]|jgi:superfamily II DNA or RNA helicase
MFEYFSDYFQTVNPNVYENEELREPQINAYDEAYQYFVEDGKSNHAVIVLPTGCGKTGLMGILPYKICEGRVLIITPQLVIKDTVLDSLDPENPINFWIARDVFNSADELPSVIEYEGNSTSTEVLESANMVILNIQKLQQRLTSSLINRVSPDFFNMIIIDEAHHSVATTWLEALNHFKNAKVVKLTGTPFRSDGRKITGEYIYEYPLSKAIAYGYIKFIEKFTHIPDQLYLTLDKGTKQYTLAEIRNLNLKDEDWINRSVAYSEDCSMIVAKKSIEILQKKRAISGLPHKIIAVACSIPHADQLKEIYEGLELRSIVIHSGLTKQEISNGLLQIENDQVDVVINVAMLGEGYDHKYLSVAAIFRPFKTLLPYSQFIGRVLRAIPNTLNQEDNVASVIYHQELGLDDLWEYYKKECDKARTIKWIVENENISEKIDSAGQDPKIVKAGDIGNAKETGSGITTIDSLISAELEMIRKKRIEQENEKIKQLKEIFPGINEGQLRNLIHKVQSEPKAQRILRPDLYLKRKQKGFDEQIKEDIVPDFIIKYNINKENDDLKECPLFKIHRHAWIPNRIKDNAGMLSCFFENEMKNQIGKKRVSWNNDEYSIAERKLPEVVKYVDKVLSSFYGGKKE